MRAYMCIHIHTALSNTIGRFKTSQYHPTSARIFWAVVREDVLIGYVVQIEGPGSTQEIPIRNDYSTSVRVSDLLPSTQYTFEVRALKSMDIQSTFIYPTEIIVIIMHIRI